MMNTFHLQMNIPIRQKYLQVILHDMNCVTASQKFAKQCSLKGILIYIFSLFNFFL